MLVCAEKYYSGSRRLDVMLSPMEENRTRGLRTTTTGCTFVFGIRSLAVYWWDVGAGLDLHLKETFSSLQRKRPRLQSEAPAALTLSKGTSDFFRSWRRRTDFVVVVALV